MTEPKPVPPVGTAPPGSAIVEYPDLTTKHVRSVVHEVVVAAGRTLIAEGAYSDAVQLLAFADLVSAAADYQKQSLAVSRYAEERRANA